MTTTLRYHATLRYYAAKVSALVETERRSGDRAIPRSLSRHDSRRDHLRLLADVGGAASAAEAKEADDAVAPSNHHLAASASAPVPGPPSRSSGGPTARPASVATCRSSRSRWLRLRRPSVTNQKEELA